MWVYFKFFHDNAFLWHVCLCSISEYQQGLLSRWKREKSILFAAPLNNFCNFIYAVFVMELLPWRINLMWMYRLSGGMESICLKICSHLCRFGKDFLICFLYAEMFKISYPWYCYLVSNTSYQIKPECIFGNWGTAGPEGFKIDDIWYQE